MNTQGAPRVALTSAGEFIVTWFGSGVGDDVGIFARRLDAGGSPIGTEFLVNTSTTSGQQTPVVAASPTGSIMAVWSSYGGVGSDVFAQASAEPTTTLPRSGSQTLTGRLLGLGDSPKAAKKRFTLASKHRSLRLGSGDGGIDDPTRTGATLHLLGAGLDETSTLPAGSWKRLGKAGQSKGYQYTDRRRRAGPVTSVVVRAARSLDAAGEGAALGFSLATNPAPVDVVLQLGAGGRLFCLRFGGTLRFHAGKSLTAKNAPAAACPP
jgi:hypothetical protein